MKSEEAYFFVNSVREIKKILDKTNLTNDDCKIIRADGKQNHYNYVSLPVMDIMSTPL